MLQIQFTEEINNDFRSIVRCMKSKLSKKDNWFVKVADSPPTFLYQLRNFHIACSAFCYSHLVQTRVRILQAVDDEYSECAAMDHHLPLVPFFGDNNYVLDEYKKFPNAVADDISELKKIVDGRVDALGNSSPFIFPIGYSLPPITGMRMPGQNG